MQVASGVLLFAFLAQLAAEQSEEVRIRPSQPSLTNLNLLFTVGGLVRLFLFISKMNPDFFAFRLHQFSTVLESVNVKKYYRKIKIVTEQPGSDTWFFLYPKAIFFLCTESSHDLSLTSAHFTRNERDQLPTYAPLTLPKGKIKNQEVIQNEKSSLQCYPVSKR